MCLCFQKRKFDLMLSQAGKEGMVKEKVVDESELETLEDGFKSALAALKSDLEVKLSFSILFSPFLRV